MRDLQRPAASFAVWLLLAVSWVASVDAAVRIRPDQGVTFEQVDFSSFPQGSATSDHMVIRADPALLAATTGIRRGYINIDCDAGWIVRNLLIDLSDAFVVAAFSRAGIDQLFRVTLFSAFVEISPEPLLTFSRPERDVFPVGPVVYNARGIGDGEPTTPPLRHDAEQTFTADGENYSVMLPNISNIEAADNQCFPASIANSLQYLEDRYNIVVPHDNVPGLNGDNSLVGRLDALSGRMATSRASGQGISFLPMMAGKGLYLDQSGLTDSLVHRHQGMVDGGDVSTPGLTSTDDGEQVTFEWICDQIKAQNDVELSFSYEDAAGNMIGGHAVRVVGCGKLKGVPWIKYAHDMTQANPEGGDDAGTVVQRSFLRDTDNDGRLNLEASNVELLFAVSESVTDEIRSGPQAPPQTSREAVTNGANFGPALSPGAITTIFGDFDRLPETNEPRLTAEDADQNSGLPTEIAGASVTIDGVPAPLFFSGPGQINFQIPYEIKPGEASVVVTIGGASSAVYSMEIGPTAPGLFLLPPSIAGQGRAIIQYQDLSLNTPENPATVGQVVVVYLTGLGEVDNPVPTGQPALASPLSLPVAASSATIGGQEAEVQFLGLTPGFVGLAQANLRIPNLPAGDHLMVITIGDLASNEALVAVAP